MNVQWVCYLWDTPLPASEDDLSRLERLWGVELPEDFKKVIAQYQGMKPVPSSFRVGQGSNAITTLLTVSEEPKWGDTYSATHTHEEFKHFLPEGILPFAMTVTSEHLCFDYRGSPEEPGIVLLTVEGELYPIAHSFREWLDGLYELPEAQA